MLRFVLAFALAAVAMGQWWQNFQTGQSVDSIHGFRVQYDDTHDLVIFMGSDDCYLVDAAASGSEAQWDALIATDTDLHAFTDTIYKQIKSGTGVTDITQQAATDYHSRLEQWECRNKAIHEVAFTAP